MQLGLHGAPYPLQAAAHPGCSVSVCAPHAHVSWIGPKIDIDGAAIDLQQQSARLTVVVARSYRSVFGLQQCPPTFGSCVSLGWWRLAVVPHF
jgi:broad specificity polyphosphatase/5'/3'-nucleotidase SurE